MLRKIADKMEPTLNIMLVFRQDEKKSIIPASANSPVTC